MITAIVIISYILSIFLARWLDYLTYKNDSLWGIQYLMWFIPIVNIFSCFTIYCMSCKSKSNWFTGKNW